MKKNNGEVQVHTSQPMNFLLCGAMPIISSKIHKKKEEKNNLPLIFRDMKTSKSVDLSLFPPTVSLVTPKRPKTTFSIAPKRKSDQISTANFSKIQEERGFISTMKDDLKARDDNDKRKSVRIHQEWEEKFNNPYRERLRRSLEGKRYQNYRRARSRAITAMGQRPLFSTTDSDDAVTLPAVRVSVSGLEDRIMHCKSYERKQRELERTVLESSESERERLEREDQAKKVLYKELRPANEILARAAETRFFDDHDHPRPIGRKVFHESYKDKVGNEMDYY